MTPDQLKQLRRDLKCSAKELANYLGITHGELQAWESGERFPTKRMEHRLAELAKNGKLDRGRTEARSPSLEADAMARLSEPEFWSLIRKLCAHDSLYRDVLKQAESYDDPTPQ